MSLIDSKGTCVDVLMETFIACLDGGIFYYLISSYINYAYRKLLDFEDGNLVQVNENTNQNG